MSKTIVWFHEVNKHDVGLVGGKGANLGEMIQAGFPVPYGFIVTANAYFYFIKYNSLASKINSILSFVNYENTTELESASDQIQKMILNGTIPKSIKTQVASYYNDLYLQEDKIIRSKKIASTLYHAVKSLYSSPLVAVRSSATAEDLPDASFAGQQETYLNIRGENALLLNIQKCWASLFTPRAIYYRFTNKYDHMSVGLASVVQRMIQSDKSGIAFSIDPVTNDTSKITIEAIYGLGEFIVQGKVTPDHYEIEKKQFKILNKSITTQTIAMVKKGGDNITSKIPEKFGNKQKITDDQIISLSKIISNIEKHYYFPQDIEWAIEKDTIYIVQSRPITTIHTIKDTDYIKAKEQPLLKGSPASPGVSFGEVMIIQSPLEIHKIKQGQILVAPQTNPDYVPAMKKASAIVTERGGRTSHAAIVSRELGIPAVVGVQNALKILKNEKIITVNGTTGTIYKGNVMSSKSHIQENNKVKKVKTLTKIYLNLAEPESAEKASKLDVDGVGLLRAEFMIANIGTHPKYFIESNTQKDFIKKLAIGIAKIVKSFNPRPVIYRATDFKTNEYRHLKGGLRYEHEEENPMLGYRGCARYIIDRKTFQMEIQALKIVREMGYKNIHLMIPFIRHPQELVEIKKMLAAEDMDKLPSFKLWIMVEIPSVAIRLKEYIALGIDGISIGTNDLTMLTLGVDRDNETIAHLYSERDESVLYLLKKIVKTAHNAGITVSICGQAASDYPEIGEDLISLGLTSLSVNMDAVDRVRKTVFSIENKLWQHK